MQSKQSHRKAAFQGDGARFSPEMRAKRGVLPRRRGIHRACRSRAERGKHRSQHELFIRHEIPDEVLRSAWPSAGLWGDECCAGQDHEPGQGTMVCQLDCCRRRSISIGLQRASAQVSGAHRRGEGLPDRCTAITGPGATAKQRQLHLSEHRALRLELREAR
ncbi:MAG: hypothetical protein A4E46_00794 [Methanosaeta sp. PtaU1.Bin016]|nr:MAG: hypothetical protein A4E46_00794 [Methanosaeta sp. PtaU1.Bin016]